MQQTAISAKMIRNESSPLAEQNWLLTVSYEGAGYSGWQFQPGQPTIQGFLQDRLAALYKSEIETFGCSRTDAGVHALSQMVTFYPPRHPSIPLANLEKALNDSLPPDIRIRGIKPMPSDFHARFNAVGKAYSYLIFRGDLRSPFVSRFCWTVNSCLALPAIEEAAAILTGTHDFTAFSVNPRRPEPDNIRKLYRVEIHEIGHFLLITIIGDGFLYKMVRRVVGFLMAVGRGRIKPGVGRQLLESRERSSRFDTAPPQGLFLEEVFYKEDDLNEHKTRQLPFLELLGLSGVTGQGSSQ